MPGDVERQLHNEVAGAVYGTSFQAGVVHGDVHLHERATGSSVTVAQAVECLSSDNTVIRAAGVHLLDDLGNRYPELRQFVLDLLCTCLRLDDRRQPASDERRVFATVQQTVKTRLAEPRNIAARMYYSNHGNRAEDDEFGKQYWPGLNGDLRGTTLVDFDASECWIDAVDFSGARFVGRTASFRGTYFSAAPKFDRAEFVARADFSHCYFNSGASFEQTHFAAGASFREAYFTGPFSHAGVPHSAMDTMGLRHFQTGEA